MHGHQHRIWMIEGAPKNGRRELRGHVHTSYRLSMSRTLPAGDEHHVLLADVRISILQEEHLVNPIVLKCREFGEYANWSSQALLNHQILLSTNLPQVSYSYLGMQ